MNFRLLLFLLTIVILRLLFFKLPYKDGQTVRIIGQVSREVIVYDRTQQIEVAGLRMYIDRYPEVNYGDKVVVRGVVNAGKLDDAELEKIETSQNILFTLRNKIIEFYKNSLPEPHSSLIAGVALGSKSSMPEGFWVQLKASGTAHVVVASGMNVTLIGGFVLNSLVNVVNRRKAIVLVLTSIWIYTLLAGFDAPIVRAAVMGSVAFSAQIFGRLNKALNALFWSIALMLIVNPLWLTDIGFQLSTFATASLILFETKVERLMHFVPSVIRSDLATSIAAQIGVAPLLIFYFGSFNLLSPVINAFVLWTIPLITISGMAAGLLGLLVPFLGKMILYLIFPLSTWFITIVRLASGS